MYAATGQIMPVATGQNDAHEDDEIESIFGLDQASMEDKRCPICNEIRTRKTLIECTKCNSNFHISCVKITKAQAKLYPNYTCKDCWNVNTPTTEPSNESHTDNGTNSEFDILQHLKTCKTNISLIGNFIRA